MRTLLISPPYRPPNEGTLGIATLRPILEAAGHSVRELHGSMWFPRVVGDPAPALFHWNARHAFHRALGGWDIETYVDMTLKSMLSDLDPHQVIAPDPGRAWESFGVDEARMRFDLRAKVEAADHCFDQMVATERDRGPVDVIGISAMFTDQVSAGIVLARRFRALWPEVKIVFGGAVCLEEQSEGLLATFPEIDAVCAAEGEDVVVPLFEAIHENTPLSAIPGVVWRVDDIIHRNASPPPMRDLDRLPVPAYDEFIAALANSEWADEGANLFFETSRGCWWGQKSLCTFCGLNGEGLVYRSKSPGRAADEIRELYLRYPTVTVLRAADNILDMKYLTGTFPKLEDLAADVERPLQLFFEVKSNLRPDQIEQLVRGGVTEVQPGIESFSDDILTLMRKGNTAMGQIQFVKWAAEAGLETSYNVLVLNPGETTQPYRDMLALVPFIEHLPPPQGTVSVLLERFSPYHANPGEFGITNVRPDLFFRTMFGERADPRLAYKFEFEHPMYRDAEHIATVRQLVARVREWRARWREDRAFYMETEDTLMVVDRREGVERRHVLGKLAARLYRYLDRNRTRGAIERELMIDPAILDASLELWLHQRWICQIGDRYLAVLPRKGPRAMAVEPVTVAKRAVHLAVVSA